MTLHNGASHLPGSAARARDTAVWGELPWGVASGSFSAEGSSDRRDVSVSWNHLGEVTEMTWACTRCVGVRVLRAQVSCHGQRLVLAAERSPSHERAHIHGLALLHPAHAHSNTLLPSASRQARAQHPHAPASSSLRAQVRRVR